MKERTEKNQKKRDELLATSRTCLQVISCAIDLTSRLRPFHPFERHPFEQESEEETLKAATSLLTTPFYYRARDCEDHAGLAASLLQLSSLTMNEWLPQVTKRNRCLIEPVTCEDEQKEPFARVLVRATRRCVALASNRFREEKLLTSSHRLPESHHRSRF